jgi:putative ABC transport system substrate-binding protein
MLNRPGHHGCQLPCELTGLKALSCCANWYWHAPIGVRVNSTNPALADSLWKDAQEAAATPGVQVHLLRRAARMTLLWSLSLAQLGTRALIIGADGFFTSRIELLAQLTLQHGLPAICSYREFSLAGGLISYGTSVIDAYRQVGVYTGKILKGEKLADLPVMQPTKFEFVLNLRRKDAGTCVLLPCKLPSTRIRSPL